MRFRLFRELRFEMAAIAGILIQRFRGRTTRGKVAHPIIGRCARSGGHLHPVSECGVAVGIRGRSSAWVLY